MDTHAPVVDHQSSGHGTAADSTSGGVLPRQFVRAMLDDARYTDAFLDALEARVVALEELVAARGIRRLRATRRLARALRASVRPFAGRPFAEARFEAVSTESPVP